MTKRTRRRAGRKSRKRNGALPGWVHMFSGLAIGLTVAAGIYINDRSTFSARQSAEPPAPAVPSVARPKPKIEEEVQDGGVSFDFYEMLPNLDVEIFTDSQRPRRAQSAPKQVTTPGVYILQAGSFSKLEDAKKREGQIALLGVRAEIKKGDANGRIVYRVYTRPLEIPAEVNRLTSKLNDNGIETLAKRVQ